MITTHPISKNLLKKCDEVSSLMSSLSHPVRLKVLCHMMEEARTVNELTEFCGISQSAMSQFLGRMKVEGLLVSERNGHFIHYRIANTKVLKLLKAVKEIFC